MKKWLKVTVVVVTGLMLAAATYVLNKSYIESHTSLQPVAVALETTTPYSKLTKYELVEKVRASIPEDAVTDLKYLTDKQWYAGSIGIGEGDIIRKSRLVDETNNPFGKALILEKDKVLVGIETSLLRSAGANIKPGVLVNALVFRAGDQRGEADTVISVDDNSMLGNLLVKEVKNADAADATSKAGKGKEAIPTVVVLETTVPVAKYLVLCQETGKIYLSPVGVDIKTLYKIKDNITPDPTPVSTAPTTTASPAKAKTNNLSKPSHKETPRVDEGTITRGRTR